MSIHTTDSARDPRAISKPLAVTVKAARNLTGLGNTTLWKLIGDGTLATVRVGRRRLIVFKSIEELIAPASEASNP